MGEVLPEEHQAATQFDEGEGDQQTPGDECRQLSYQSERKCNLVVSP